MRRLLARLLILAAPSVPLGLRGRVATQASVSGSRGEARPGTGSGTPEGGVLPVPRPPVPHPDFLLNYRPPPELREWLNDFALAGAIEKWTLDWYQQTHDEEPGR